MSAPKQIIYPMRYLRPLLSGGSQDEQRFEVALRSFLGCNVHVIPLGRARAGLYLLAKHARHDGRDRVIMLPYTIPDVVNMIRFAGCEPVFVDTLPNSTNVDLDHLRTLIDSRTCCVLLTHYHVNQDRIDDIRELCRKRNVLLFDDCAIALEGDYEGARMGSVTDGSVFSMSGFKTLNYIWGGAVATQRDELHEALKNEISTFPRLRPHQYRQHMMMVMKYDAATREPLFSWLTLPALRKQISKANGHDVLSITRRETAVLEESVLSRPALGALRELARKLGGVDARLAHRRKIASVYDGYLADRRVSPETSDKVRAGSCFVGYPVAVDPDRRDEVVHEMIGRGFHVGASLYPNVHEAPAFKDAPGRSRNVSGLVRSSIWLPTHPKVDPSYASALGRTLTEVLQKGRKRISALVAGLALQLWPAMGLLETVLPVA